MYISLSLLFLSLSVLLESKPKWPKAQYTELETILGTVSRPLFDDVRPPLHPHRSQKIGDYHLIWQSSQANFHLQYCVNPN